VSAAATATTNAAALSTHLYFVCPSLVELPPLHARAVERRVRGENPAVSVVVFAGFSFASFFFPPRTTHHHSTPFILPPPVRVYVPYAHPLRRRDTPERKKERKKKTTG
jgi:hypothetical protein